MNRSNVQIYAIMEIAKDINSTVNINVLLEKIIEYARKIINAQGCSMLLVNKDKKELYFSNATGEKSDMLKNIRVPIGKGIAGSVALTGEPIIINNALEDNRIYRQVDEEIENTTRNLICVPLRIKNRIIGVIEVVNAIGRDGFSNDDMVLLSSFAEQAAIAITNRKLNNELKQRIYELETLYEISTLLNKEAFLDKEIYRQALKKVAQILHASDVVIYLLEEDRLLPFVSSSGDVGNAITEDDVPLFFSLIRKGKDMLCKRGDENSYDGWQFEGGSSIIIVLESKDKRLGVMIINSSLKRVFSEIDLRLCKLIGNQIADSIENERLKNQEIEKNRIEKELEIMRSIQESILPDSFFDVDEIDVYGFSKPALDVGGDFYDYYKLNDSKYGVVIADVAGKGLPASLYMAMSKTIIKVEAGRSDDPGEVLENANRYVFLDSKLGTFVTAFYLVIDVDSMLVRFANAGHSHVLHYNIKNGDIGFLKARGIPLGVNNGAKYVSREVRCSRGDFIFLYTDGVVEAINEDMKEYGEDRLMKVLKENANKPISDILMEVFNDIERFAGDVKQFDDITMIGIRFK